MVAELIARLRSLWRGVARTQDVDADLKEEFRLHIELRTEDLVRSGLPEAAAQRQARAEFGSTADHLEQARRARGLRWFDGLRISWLDLKLGGRMLVKYPVLTVVSGVSMAFAIWVGAGTFEALRQLVAPAIPLPASDRLVVLQNWDAAASRPEQRAAHDFVRWREALRSVDDLAAYRTVARNLTGGAGVAEPVLAAEVTASTFRALRVPPLLGRALDDADERPGAPLVAVIGYDLWQNRFHGDPQIVGRTVRVTGTLATIVGVMPDGFAFPRNQELWTPLRVGDEAYLPRQGATIDIIGRLAPGASLAEARAELTSLGHLAASDFPLTHAQLRPQVITFAESVRALGGSDGGAMMLTGNIFVLLLLAIVCANVGLLMYARAATRETEIVVRSALGASRRRIVAQMFAEALVLGVLAAAVGLTAAGWGLRWALDLLRGELTDGSGNFAFWVDGRLSPMTIAYTALLTVIAAAIAGILPGLKITRNLGDRLKSVSAGSGSAHFGGLWTVIIVLQLAVTMGFPVATHAVRRDAVRVETQAMPFPVDRYLSVRLEMERYPALPGIDTSAAGYHRRYHEALRLLEQRLMTEPSVIGVTFGQQLPRQYHPNHRIEVDEGALPPYDERGHLVASTRVDVTFLDAFGVTPVSGRWFTSSDAKAGARVAVVNQAFVARIMGGGNPIGRRIQYPRRVETDEPLPWYQVVGVVPDMGTNSGWGPAGIYLPLVREAASAPGAAGAEAGPAAGTEVTPVYPLNLAIHLRGDPMAFAQQLRSIASGVDESLHLAELMPLRSVVNGAVAFLDFWVMMTTIVSVMVLVLSLVAIYAVMSFAVARRTREIGVRVALGGRPMRIVAAVLAQPLRQLGMGVLAGSVLTVLLTGTIDDGLPTMGQVVTLTGYILAITAVYLLACIVPTLRALAVQPTEALRQQ